MTDLVNRIRALMAPTSEPETIEGWRELSLATDEQWAAVLRDDFRWSYVIRSPLGGVCAYGRGTRNECVREGFKSADESAMEMPADCTTPELEHQALNGPWRLSAVAAAL
jgi:hypothetical protein